MIHHGRKYTTMTAVFAVTLGLALASSPLRAAGNDGRELLVYASVTTTTPLAPLCAVLEEGLPQGFTARIEYWKNLDDLRGLMLAGKGDIWVGDIEGFARAAFRGAPVSLLAVTGWKKFFFLSQADAPALGVNRDKRLAFMAAELAKDGNPLPVAPPGGPGASLLEEISRRGGPAFTLAPMPAQQLMLEMVRGSRRYAVLPEPLVSALLAKKGSIAVMGSVEEEFSRLYGGPARLPLTGIALNSRLAEANPGFALELAVRMTDQAERLAGDADAAVAILPAMLRESLGTDVLAASLSRDMILALPADQVLPEIKGFLRLVTAGEPASLPADGLPSADFVFRLDGADAATTGTAQ